MSGENKLKAVPASVVKCRDQVHPWQVDDSEGVPVARFISQRDARGYVGLAEVLARMEKRINEGVSYRMGDDLVKLIEEARALITMEHEA